MVSAQAQNTTLISVGTKLTMSGNVRLVAGAGKLINNGTIGGTTGTLQFAGPVNFSGTGTTQVQNFIVSHSSAFMSVLNAPLDVTNMANLMFGNITMNDNLILRSDISNTANLVVSGEPSGLVQGLTAKAAPAIGGCAAFNTTLTVNISGPQVKYQWQSSPDSIIWSDITAATSHDYAARVTAPYFYRCRIGNTVNNDFTQFVDPVKVSLDTSVTVTSAVGTTAVGNNISLTAIEGTGSWNSSDVSILTVSAVTGLATGVSAGAAAVTYTGSNSAGCPVKKVVLISVMAVTTTAPVPVVIIHNPVAVCSPASIDLTAAAVTAGSSETLTYTYYSDAGGTVLFANPGKVSASGTYYIVGTNTAGVRSAPSPVVISIISAPSLTAGFTSDSYCINTPVSFTNASVVQGQVVYQWSDNSGKTSSAAAPSFTYTQPGNVSMKLKVSSLVCPLVQDSVTKVIVIEAPTTGIRMQAVNVVVNEPTTIQARNIGSASYTWTPAANLSATNIIDPKVTVTNSEQEYRVAIKVTSGCITTDTVLVRIFAKYIYVPNVFSPNGDGMNDVLFVNIIGNGMRSLTYFRVYNRYSKLVFQTTDATVGWDGKVNGVLQPLDTYVWMAEVKDAAGISTRQQGSVSLLR